MAADQRYCLECGERRTPVSSFLLGGAAARGGSRASAVEAPALVRGVDAAEGAGQRGNAVTVIAGVGVLLLAMGVGVLIGRSGGSNSKPTAAPPQVISVSQPGAAAGVATPTTPAPTTTTPATSPKSGSSSAKPGAAKGASGVGSSPSNPAPPTVLKNLRKGSGQSYEQKSKNLPNVVSTG